MYCKHCGKEIDDNSSFCKYCGKSQESKSNRESKKFIPIIGWAVYVIWAIINLCLLINENKSVDAINYLFPYHTSYTKEYWGWFYDITDIIVYVFIIPVIIYIVLRRYGNRIKKSIGTVIIYVIWVITNYALLWGDKAEEPLKDFYPFPNRLWIYERSWLFYNHFNLSYYDYSEFVVYAFIIPAIIFFIYRRFKKPIDKVINKLLNRK